ncbi:MAG: archease [Gemmatimonadota bacterium]
MEEPTIPRSSRHPEAGDPAGDPEAANRSETGVVELDHTADVGFTIEADSLHRLFELAATGLVRATGWVPTGRKEGAPDAAVEEEAPSAGREGPAGCASEAIRLARPDLERLLVAWLRELTHRIEQRGAPAAIRAHVVESGDPGPSLEATVSWPTLDPGLQPVREIKGVTYHGLRIAREGKRWSAHVVLDV